MIDPAGSLDRLMGGGFGRNVVSQQIVGPRSELNKYFHGGYFLRPLLRGTEMNQPALGYQGLTTNLGRKITAISRYFGAPSCGM